jgi:hypothetical protein
MDMIIHEKNQFILQNIENYRSVLTETNNEIFTKYISIVEKYLEECNNSIYIQNKQYNKYVVGKGIETLKHVFNMILLYTKNLNLAVHHCNKSLCFYVEFIGQIGDDNHSFLQLNSNDAALFVYKKTIFDINNEYRKDFVLTEDDKKKNDIFYLSINIYNCILEYLIQKYDINDHVPLHQYINKNINKITLNILQLYFIYENDNLIKILQVIDILVKNIKNKNIDNIIPVIEKFIIKNQKRNLIKADIEKKIYKQDFDQKIKTYTPQRFVNWLYVN